MGMLWIKVALACLAIAFSVGIGYLAANKYRCRRNFFSQLSDFNERYINELEYARKPLPVFLKETSATGDFKKTLEEFSSSRAPQLKFSYLTKEEKKECTEYFSMLGRGDALSQKGYFCARREPLGEVRAACEKQAKAKGELYLKLGLLAGLAFVILII